MQTISASALQPLPQQASQQQQSQIIQLTSQNSAGNLSFLNAPSQKIQLQTPDGKIVTGNILFTSSNNSLLTNDSTQQLQQIQVFF